MNPAITKMLTGVDLGKVIGDLTGLLENVGQAGEDRREFREKGMELVKELETAWSQAEVKMAESTAAIAIADSQGQSAFQRVWRPIGALTTVVNNVIVVDLTLYALFKQVAFDPGYWNLAMAYIAGAFGVLGIYNWQRSDEKKTAMRTIAEVTTAPLRAEQKEARKGIKNRAKVAKMLRKQGFSEEEITEILQTAGGESE